MYTTTLVLLACLGGLFAPRQAAADATIGILVLREHGIGTPTLVQPYLDRFVEAAARQNEWKSAKGQYYVTRTGAEDYISREKPHYAILSLGAFLDFRVRYNLEVIGQVSVAIPGGQQYFIVSKSQTSLDGCKGEKLASDHITEARFIEKVVGREAFRLAEFKLVPTQRPLQTIKEVVAGRADCALIDDAQRAELAKISSAGDLKSVWESQKLPPMVVAAFPTAPTAERLRFQKNFNKVCEGPAKSACEEVGIQALDPASAADYAAVVAAYR